MDSKKLPSMNVEKDLDTLVVNQLWISPTLIEGYKFSIEGEHIKFKFPYSIALVDLMLNTKAGLTNKVSMMYHGKILRKIEFKYDGMSIEKRTEALDKKYLMVDFHIENILDDLHIQDWEPK